MVNKNKNNKKTKLIILGVLALLIAGGVFLAMRSQSDDTNRQAPDSQNQGSSDSQNESNQAKDRIVQQDEAIKNQQPQAGKKAVTPLITYGGQYGPDVEVGGYINGVFEDGGNCTATFTKDGSTLTKSVTAEKGANSVDCPVMALPSSQFNPKGTWKVTLSYSSPTAEGSSTPKDIEVK